MEQKMNSTTKEILTELLPEMAIIVYKNDHKYYLERRDIINGKMASGIPLTEKCLTDIFNVISSEESNILHGAVPDNMLYADSRCGREKYVWYNKPMKRSLLFSKEAGIPDGQMWVPGLVYAASASSLSVFAFKGRNPKNNLFRAPFFNIYNDGRVCLGSAKVDKPYELTFDSIMKYWEKMFWASEFAHLIGSNPVKGNLSTITKNSISTGCKFPDSELIPAEQKLKSLIQEI